LPTGTPTPAPTPTPLPSPTSSPTITPEFTCECGSDLYNCGDTANSRSFARACYAYCMMVVGYDVHDLDRDNDGRVCE
jgi:hypothetical protein